MVFQDIILFIVALILICQGQIKEC